MKEERSNKLLDPALLSERLESYPPRLITALLRVAEARGLEFFVIGGTVRDWLLGRTPGDLDITVAYDAVACCRSLIAELGGGTFVPLGRAEEDAGRVAWQGLTARDGLNPWEPGIAGAVTARDGLNPREPGMAGAVTIDFSSFRLGARTIEADLSLRDYTVNAMGISLASLVDRSAAPPLIDPLLGYPDLEKKILRACPHAFLADPLRMLRGYRLSATLGFSLEEATKAEIRQHAGLIRQVSVERISHELDLMMASGRAHVFMGEMAQTGLLRQLIPELVRGVGMEQPGSHHLDVFDHSLTALGCMEEILAAPERFYPECAVRMKEYIGQSGMKARLKWAALLHDLGKPVTMVVRDGQRQSDGARAKDGQDDRITFYGHDQAGKELVLQLGRELKWSNEKREGIAALVGMHMQPFHLCNVRRKQPLSRKACLNLCRKAGNDLLGLFLVAMSDSLAGKGENKPPAMEAELAGLLEEVLQIYEQYIKPALKGPRLLSGQDLITIFSLQPGPLFAKILDALEVAQVEGEVSCRQDAQRWVRHYLEREEKDGGGET
ncbi:MAG: HD domain-containing protein [Desulfoarculaceae bacterium]|nr:HD domain-containing protein [Desulfoarculaceae bacterium]